MLVRQRASGKWIDARITRVCPERDEPYDVSILTGDLRGRTWRRRTEEVRPRTEPDEWPYGTRVTAIYAGHWYEGTIESFLDGKYTIRTCLPFEDSMGHKQNTFQCQVMHLRHSGKPKFVEGECVKYRSSGVQYKVTSVASTTPVTYTIRERTGASFSGIAEHKLSHDDKGW